MKKKRKAAPTKRQATPPTLHPSDGDVRVAAMLAVMREQLAMFERATFADRTCTVDLEDVPSRYGVELLSGVTVEQVIARCIVEGTTARGLAGALGLPPIVIREAIDQLACGARVDWTPRGKAVG